MERSLFSCAPGNAGNAFFFLFFLLASFLSGRPWPQRSLATTVLLHCVFSTWRRALVEKTKRRKTAQ